MVSRRDGTQLPTDTLLEILDKVLDKGLVVAGDIRVEVASVELLSIKIRLLVCSIDKAQEIGLNWWESDPFLSNGAGTEVEGLRTRIEALEHQLALSEKTDAPANQPVYPQPEEGKARPGKDGGR